MGTKERKEEEEKGEKHLLLQRKRFEMMRRRRQNLKEREEKKSNGGGGKRDITRVIRGLRRPSVRKEKERNIEGGWKRGAEKQTIATPASTLLPHQRLFAATRKPKKGSASSRCNKGGGMKRGGGGRKTTEGIDSGDEGAHEESMIDGVRTNEIPQDDPAHVPIFRMGEKPPLVRETLLRRGWTEWSEDVHEEMEWTLYWRSGGIKPSYIRTSNGQQRINHYLKSGVITRKDQLQRVLRKLKGVYGSVYNFVPTSYILPGEYTKFVKEYALQEKPTLWICKPTNASRGRDIFLIRDLGDLKYDRSMIVQRYIVNPLLVGGYKVDLRIYVLVVSYAPLEVYIYRDGLARSVLDYPMYFLWLLPSLFGLSSSSSLFLVSLSLSLFSLINVFLFLKMPPSSLKPPNPFVFFQILSLSLSFFVSHLCSWKLQVRH